MTPAIPGALTVVPPGERTSRRLRPPGAALHPAGTGGIGVELFDIATGLARAARSFDLDDGDETRRYARVVSTEAYEAWVIRWAPAADLTLHDHGGSRGVVVVVDGELVEVRPALDVGSAPRRRALRRGATATIGADTIHAVSNLGPSTALSVHVYSPPLAAMTFYDAQDGCVTPTQTSGVRSSPRVLLVP